MLEQEHMFDMIKKRQTKNQQKNQKDVHRYD